MLTVSLLTLWPPPLALHSLQDPTSHMARLPRQGNRLQGLVETGMVFACDSDTEQHRRHPTNHLPFEYQQFLIAVANFKQLSL
jgi:hypothetical protein